MLTPGYSLQVELANLVSAGFTPMQAITAATRDAARVLGLDADIGTVEVGKAVWVFVDGRIHDPAEQRAAVRGSIGLR